MTEHVHSGQDILRRRNRTIGMLVGGIIVFTATAVFLGIWAVSGPDRANSSAVTTAFVSRYAIHDPSVCELATPELAAQLADDGRCDGSASGQSPQVRIQHIQDCGADSLAWVRVNPSGRVGQPYASIGLERVGQQWSVDSIRPSDHAMPVAPAACDTRTEYED